MTKANNIPNWINQLQFNDILSNEYQNFKEITKFDVKSALNGGENYLTRILSVEIDIKLEDNSTKTIKYILKIPLSCENNEEHEYHELFEMEADMYTNLIPELEEIFAFYNQTVKFKPKHYRFTVSPESDYILMEDLREYGFKNVDRLIGLDEEHTKFVLRKLAQWHAVTAKRVELKGPYAERYIKGYFTEEDRPFIESMNTGFTRPFLECMEKYNLEKSQKILIYSQNLTDLYLQFGKIDENSFNVLNHGDFWINNFMFNYYPNTENLNGIRFVDFQMPKYGSPAQDLLCFLMTSPKMELKLKKFNDFVQYYHSELLNYLRILDYKKPIPDLGNLRKTLQENGLWAFVCAQRMLSIALLDPSEASNIDDFMSDNAEGLAFKKRLLSNPRFVNQIEQILPWLMQEGYLRINLETST